jgi:hypothetical protein
MSNNLSVNVRTMSDVGDPDEVSASLILHRANNSICRLLFALRNVRQIGHRSSEILLIFHRPANLKRNGPSVLRDC